MAEMQDKNKISPEEEILEGADTEVKLAAEQENPDEQVGEENLAEKDTEDHENEPDQDTEEAEAGSEVPGDEPVKRKKSAKPAKSARPEKSARPAKSARLEKSARPVKSARAEKDVSSVKKAEAAKSEKTTKKVHEEKNSRKGKPLYTVLLLILCLEMLAFAVLTATGRISFSEPDLSSAVTAADVREGISYLNSINAQDAAEVVASVNDANKQRHLEQIMKNQDAIWAAFDDSCIVGDSRVVGFWYFEYLPDTRAISDGGAMIKDIPMYLERLEVMNPSKVFLAFGLNDYGIGTWPDVHDYTDVYVENVKMIQEVLPGVEIYVNSTLPAVGVGLDASPAYPRIPEYNEALREMCEREGYHFIDNDEIGRENEYLYNDDGLHLQREFYPIWAMNMLEEVIN